MKGVLTASMLLFAHEHMRIFTCIREIQKFWRNKRKATGGYPDMSALTYLVLCTDRRNMLSVAFRTDQGVLVAETNSFPLSLACKSKDCTTSFVQRSGRCDDEQRQERISPWHLPDTICVLCEQLLGKERARKPANSDCQSPSNPCT